MPFSGLAIACMVKGEHALCSFVQTRDKKDPLQPENGGVEYGPVLGVNSTTDKV